MKKRGQNQRRKRPTTEWTLLEEIQMHGLALGTSHARLKDQPQHHLQFSELCPQTQTTLQSKQTAFPSDGHEHVPEALGGPTPAKADMDARRVAGDSWMYGARNQQVDQSVTRANSNLVGCFGQGSTSKHVEDGHTHDVSNDEEGAAAEQNKTNTRGTRWFKEESRASNKKANEEQKNGKGPSGRPKDDMFHSR